MSGLLESHVVLVEGNKVLFNTGVPTLTPGDSIRIGCRLAHYRPCLGPISKNGCPFA